jgi:hypothetical protein
MNQITKNMPECIEELIFGSGFPDFPYFSSGTGFYAIYENTDPKPMPPWEWRHGGKNEPSVQTNASGCQCSAETYCTGPRGGKYCIAPSGKKKY